MIGQSLSTYKRKVLQYFLKKFSSKHGLSNLPFFYTIPFLAIELCVFSVVLDQRYLELASYVDQDRIFVGFVVHSSHHFFF
jgi:hypothetical protein